MNKKTLDILFYTSIIVLCLSLTSCVGKNRKLETHPTNNLNDEIYYPSGVSVGKEGFDE